MKHSKLTRFRTANEGEMKLSLVVCTANIAGVASGDWALIAPYGDHPAPDGSYVQRFSRDQADAVVRTWNSITGRAARLFKNLWHGLGGRASLPVWDGHPETDKQRWPMERLLAEITDLRSGEAGLEGRIVWSANSDDRTRGPLYPSPLWWHWPPAGEPPAVYPELLESIGLVPTPNISSVPAWTANATLAGGEQPETQKDNDPMNQEQMAALRKALGLAEDADAAGCITAAQTANASALRLTEQEAAHAALTTANGTLTTERDDLKTERDDLKTKVDGLTTANAALTTGILDVVEKRGVITSAERKGFEDKLTANAASTLVELRDRKPAMNTQSVEINGNRVDLSTSNSRMSALESAIQRRMADDKVERDEAFKRCQADPSLKPLFDAMNTASKAA